MLLVTAMLVLWSKYLRRSKSLQRELFNYVIVIVTQLTFTYVYPAYTFVFRTLGPVPQVALALLLPAIKIFAKNWMSYLLQDLEDLKPEFIIFNIEVFHALFVSSCMQSAASYNTTLILMSTDFVFGALALRRILKTVRKFHASLGANSSRHRSTSSLQRQQQGTDKSASDAAVQWTEVHFLEVALYILETDPNLLRSNTTSLYPQVAIRRFSQVQPNDDNVTAAAVTQAQAQQTSNKTKSSISTRVMTERSARASQSLPSCAQEPENTYTNCDDTDLKAHHTQGPTLPQRQSMIQQQAQPRSPKQQTQPRLGCLHSVRSQLDAVKLTAKLSKHDKALVATLDDHDHLRYVQHMLGLLFWAEFILLVEFTEVIVPIVYSTSLSL